MSRRLFAAALGVAAIALGAASCSLVSGLDDLEFAEGDGGTPCTADAACDDANACTLDSCGASGLCAHEAAPDGPSPTQTPGDCKAQVCEGGKALHTNKAEGTTCVVSGAAGHCDAQGTCQIDCGPDNPCDDGEPCTTDTCLSSGLCSFMPLDGVPTPGTTDTPGDCKARMCVGGEDKTVSDNTDVPDDGKECTDGICFGGIPQHVPKSMGVLCNGGVDVCDQSGDCIDCTASAECGASKYCAAGDCVAKKSNGALCAALSECQSGHCVEGVCCDTACTGVCQTCVAAKKGSGQDGACSPIKAGTDPDNECAMQPAATCGTTGVCSGGAACQKYQSGTVCNPAVCANGTTLNKADTCDGNGTCVDGGTQICSSNVCMGGMCVP